MPEVIKTVITADATEHAAAFARAAQHVVDYRKKESTAGSKALEMHRLELRALELEASGFKALAASMRQGITLREQAARLAVQSNITEKEAQALLERKLQLQRNIATAAEQEARSRQAAASRAAAIANPGATGLPGGGGLAPLTPQSLAVLDRTILQQRELRRQTLLAGQGGKNGALGFLAFSQAVEDAQYGIRGVLNNIPQMVLGFGGGAGLAGALSLAAVAGAALYPRLKELYGVADNEVLARAAKQWGEIFEKGMSAARTLRTEALVARETEDAARGYNQALEARLGLFGALSQSADRQLSRDREERRLALEILEARADLAKARRQPTPGARRATDDLEDSGLRADLANRELELRRLQTEQERVTTVRDNLTAEANENKQRNLAEQLRMTEELAGAEANLAETSATLEELHKQGKLDGRLNVQLATQKEAVEQRKRELEIFKAQAQAAETATDAQARAAAEGAQQLQGRVDQAYQESEALKGVIRQRKELLDLQRQTAAAEASNKGLDKVNAQYAKDEAAYREAVQRGNASKEKRRGEAGARADFNAEVIALKLELRGRKDLADAFRKETALRKEAAEYARNAKVSEQEALRLLRQKQLLQDAAAGRARERRPGINRLANGPRDFNAGNNLADWKWRLSPGMGRLESRGSAGRHIEGGVRNMELGRRANERARNAPRAVDSSLKVLEEIRESNRQTADAMKRLGLF